MQSVTKFASHFVFRQCSLSPCGITERLAFPTAGRFRDEMIVRQSEAPRFGPVENDQSVCADSKARTTKIDVRKN